MKFPKYAHSFEVVADLPSELEGLKRLATNLQWSWNHETLELFREMDRPLWEFVEHNPLQLLDQISPEKLRNLAHDQGFLTQIAACKQSLVQALDAKKWFQHHFPNFDSNAVFAYFCAEFGITEALPIYSGGLGILAGDHLKAASDLGLPLVGVGLLYSRGYFRQSLTPDGWQQENYPQYDFVRMPLHLQRDANGHSIKINVEFPDRNVTCQVWGADVGRVKLVLLDSNVLENAPTDQGITDTLYGGDQEMRIRQEIILGVGGMRALKALGIKPAVCHMNEGHAAFLSLERIRQFKQEFGCDAKTARKVIVSSNVFTTHTPVPAGFDLFPEELLKSYASKLIEPLEMPFSEFMKLGRFEPENEGEPFNMAIFAMENANRVNGVSKLHARVTRSMFESRWNGYPEDEAPVEAVTNGIHTMTWVSRKIAQLFDQYLGTRWRSEPHEPDSWSKVRSIPDQELWDVRESMRDDLVRYARKRLRIQLQKRGSSIAELNAAETVLDPKTLTIGFARRFATYKRATLMLSDRERLKNLLHHPERPIQIIVAGKSHPRDDGGKTLIQELFRFMVNEGANSRLVFLEDYDMDVARHLVQGVDVWLNNPRRPHEASGTSGMKVVPNGGLNCSILDGWWDEGYAPEVGWAIGDRRDFGDEGQQDWLDGHSLYHLLESEIAPKFYDRAAGSAPSDWVRMMKESIAVLAPEFSTARMVRDYTVGSYVPAAQAYFDLTANNLERAKRALEWLERIKSAFPSVAVKNVWHNAQPITKVNSQIEFGAEVAFGALSPDEIKVQALFGQVGPGRELQDYEVVDLVHTENGHFKGSRQVEKSGHRGFAVRVIPHHPDVRVPSELTLIKWETA